MHCQTHEQTFPTLFAIAMDYLPIQASAVPCERVFSSSAETDTKKRNRIKPELMEALQILKFALKKERLTFTAELITPEKDLLPPATADDGAGDLLANLLKAGTASLDSALRSILDD
jgi:hAT family C-terminal dimerisation region